jgi:hypothetical protein
MKASRHPAANAQRGLFSLAAHAALAALVATATLTPSVADAAPVRFSYTGSVTGHIFDPRLQSDFPVGTSVSWTFTLDDTFAGLNAYGGDVLGIASQPTSGSLSLGSSVYELTNAPLYSFTYESASGDISNFVFQLQGSGPASASGGDFFGMFFSVAPDLSLLSSQIGFGYSTSVFTSYGYVDTAGSYRVERLAVPLPGTLPLLVVGLAGLAALGSGLGAGRRVTAPAARESR